MLFIEIKLCMFWVMLYYNVVKMMYCVVISCFFGYFRGFRILFGD